MNSTIKFIVWAHHRTGSTHLCSLLDSHPNIVCWRELFFKGEANSNEDYFTRSKFDNIHQFLDSFFSDRLKGQNTFRINPNKKPKAIGFKLKYNQINTYPEIVDYITNKNIMVIHLTRRNLLKHCLSIAFIPALLQKFSRVNFINQIPKEELKIPIKITTDQLISAMEREQNLIENYTKVFQEKRTINISYEDIVGESSAQTLKNILSFLGVDDTIQLQSQYHKILPAKLSSIIDDFESIKSNLTGTEYEKFLLEG